MKDKAGSMSSLQSWGNINKRELSSLLFEPSGTCRTLVSLSHRPTDGLGPTKGSDCTDSIVPLLDLTATFHVQQYFWQYFGKCGAACMPFGDQSNKHATSMSTCTRSRTFRAATHDSTSPLSEVVVPLPVACSVHDNVATVTTVHFVFPFSLR